MILDKDKLLCFLNTNEEKLEFSLKSPQTVETINFSINVSLNLTKIHYSYDNQTWYMFQRKQLITSSVDINLYATYFSLYFQKRISGTNNCTNVTLNICHDSAQPVILLNSSKEIVNDVKNFNATVTGQHGSLISCFIGNKSIKITEIGNITAVSENEVIQTKKLQVMKADIYQILCNICYNPLCLFEITCSARYPGNGNASTQNVTMRTYIYSSQMHLKTVISSSTSLLISGTILNNSCAAVQAVATIRQKNTTYPISGSHFQFNITGLQACLQYNITVNSFSVNNLSGLNPVNFNATTKPILAVLNINHGPDDTNSINISWLHPSSCVSSHNSVNIRYKKKVDRIGKILLLFVISMCV